MKVSTGDLFEFMKLDFDFSSSKLPKTLKKASGKSVWGDLEGHLVVATENSPGPFVEGEFFDFPSFDGKSIRYLFSLKSSDYHLRPIKTETNVKIPPCTCKSISYGCKCRAFIEEMEAKGRTYDRWSKTWI